jgi:Uncharacterized alpha/beta hydrolase domain (DUF2235)
MNHENRIEEIWFAGAHTNVGGGFEKDRGLSDISLRFMINRASEHKIQFCDEAFQIIGKVTGLIWEAPPLWLWKITRQIHVKNGGPGVVPKIHKSVFMRKGSGNGYDPKNVKELGNAFAREERD